MCYYLLVELHQSELSEPETVIVATDCVETLLAMSASLLRSAEASVEARTILTLAGRRCRKSHGEKR